MNSPRKINYETRPYKFTERKMLLSTFARICNYYKGEYQYIGFGGLTFTDFKLFHKELHINTMNSIEGGDLLSKERLEFNRPYSFIQIHKDLSTNVLAKIDLSKKSLVWLDYDGVLDTYMFEDLSLLIRQLPIGSIYLITCNRELKSEERGEEYTVEQFKEKFESLSPFDVSVKDFSGEKNHKTIRRMFSTLIENIMNDRNRSGENVQFQQLYNVLYQENRGAKMFTFGGIITNIDTKIEDLNLNDFLFVRQNEQTYKIEIPNLTFREEIHINQHIPNKIEELKSENIIDNRDIDKYISIYKFLPNFFDVRI
jgi:hypothetical protein